MKIKEEHYKELETALLKVIDDNPGVRQAYLKANASFTRFSWDVLHRSRFSMTELYNYMNDSHIDTALNKILNVRDYNKGI